MQSFVLTTAFAKRTVLTLPWRGRVGEASSGGRCEPGWGDLQSKDFHPTPLASLATLPLQGRVKGGVR